MGLWDALTGKTHHFTKTQQQATHQVCTALKTFVPSRLRYYPDRKGWLVRARDSLYAFYLGASGFLSCNLDDLIAKYKHALFSLNVHNYLCLLSALHTGQVVGVYLSERDSSPAAQDLFYLLTEGICDMYRRPDNYMAEWNDRLDWIAESEETIGGRLSFKVYDEIAPILGLPQSDPIECLTWAEVGFGCTGCMRAYFDDPRWSGVVEAELAKY